VLDAARKLLSSLHVPAYYLVLKQLLREVKAELKNISDLAHLKCMLKCVSSVPLLRMTNASLHVN